MYKISVPVMNVSVTEKTKDDYLAQLRLAKADRIFLVCSAGELDAEALNEICSSLSWKLRFFEENGIEAGVWICNSIGHDAGLALPDLNGAGMAKYKPLVGLDGVTLNGTRCPTDASFRADFASFVAAIAMIGAKQILLDDDFRFCLRGSSILCACDAHIKAIGALCGEAVDRDTLRQQAFVGKPNQYRSAWMRAQGDSLRSFAREIRAAVDRVDPSVCVMLCASHTLYDIDGATPAELTKILAGKNTPELRLHGAPYWDIHWPKPLPAVFEFVRSFSRMARAEGIERMMAEGDAYPRPRYNTPASHLELFDGVVRADGVSGGILKYMIEYNTSPSYETGYLRHHVSNLRLATEVEQIFDGKTDCGVETPLYAHLLEQADLDLSVMGDQYPYPSAASTLAMLSIPTAHDGAGCCCALFGENARHADPSVFAKGAFLDGIAAAILTQRGVDVGLAGEVRFEEGRAAFTVSADGCDRPCTLPKSVRFCCAEVKSEAEACLYAMDGDKRRLLLYRYENRDGQRFLVYLTDPMAKLYNHEICKGYL
ncbi:MAG: hypothetical protein IKC59_05700, partial [Clostridia bacterium]|nr:hypothetical protein [Clostridia bacterium]